MFAPFACSAKDHTRAQLACDCQGIMATVWLSEVLRSSARSALCLQSGGMTVVSVRMVFWLKLSLVVYWTGFVPLHAAPCCLSNMRKACR